ncbi:MAG: hypothetical protein M0T84_01835 [Betaproteobacteria bacterium]|nr:hypothetical protein [Betaproteobacteria bacterium]
MRDLPRADEPRLTLCSVSFHNARHLALNRRLAARLAGTGALPWVVAENTPPGGQDRLHEDAESFKVIPGVDAGHRPNYQHTEALQRCLEHVETRFLLVLDPDFYLLQPGWATTVPAYMLEHRLAFFGVPWHPKHLDKYRYFPCVHCMFIDLAQVPVDRLDFRPACADRSEAASPRRSGRLADIGRMLTLQGRRKNYRDTGTRLYREFARHPTLMHECATPVYRLPEDFPGTANPLSPRARLFEALLPDSLCYLPKRKDSYTRTGFRETTGFTLPPHWEEFMWDAAPFGFHVRRNAAKGGRDENAELALLEDALDALAFKGGMKTRQPGRTRSPAAPCRGTTADQQK